MDVSCERCKTEYELDDAQISDQGTPVKCVTCGLVFRVHKSAPPPAIAPAPVIAPVVRTDPVVRPVATSNVSMAPLRVRLARSGEVLPVRDLATVKRWIAERRVGVSDELSQAGGAYTRLALVPELAAAIPASAPPVVAPVVTPSVQSHATIAFSSPVRAPTLITPPQASSPMPAAMVIDTPPAERMPTPSPVPRAPSLVTPATTPVSAEAKVVVAPDVATDELDAISTSSIDDDDDEIRRLAGMRRSPKKIALSILGVTAVLGLGLGVLYLEAPKKFYGLFGMRITLPESAKPVIAQVQEALRQDTEAAFKAASAKLSETIAPMGDNIPAELYAARAQLEATWAVYLADQVRLNGEKVLMATKAGDTQGAIKAREIAQTAEREITQRRDTAYDTAKQAFDEAPDELDVTLALADAARLKGEKVEAETMLTKSAELAPEDPRPHLIRGEILGAAAATQPQAVMELEKAARGDPKSARPRYRLAVTELQLKHPDVAKKWVQETLAISPAHERAKALMAEPATPPPASPPAVVAAPPPLTPPASAPAKDSKDAKNAKLEVKPSAKPAETKKPIEEKAAPELEGGLKKILVEAASLREKGKVRAALALYEKGVKKHPQAAELLAGAGLCYVDLGKYGKAIESFQDALKKNAHYGDAIIGLGDAYKFNNDTARAIASYQKYLELLPNGPEAVVARNAIDSLR